MILPVEKAFFHSRIRKTRKEKIKIMKPNKIIDNPTSAELLSQLEALGNLEKIYKDFPLIQDIFPKLEDFFKEVNKAKEQTEPLRMPDQFNERFAEAGWIAYESMSQNLMKNAINIHDSQGLNIAEHFLADAYDTEYLECGIRRFQGHKEFLRRIRLVELAKEDYLLGRYHACIPLLLSLLDGLVNDVSKHVGFFAESVDVTAWDSIAAHESGLQALSSLMAKGRNKTNEDPIYIPYRNGILHGRELAFDNKLVAAKVWAALFAARDWAIAISNGKKTPKPKEEKSWPEILEQIAETERLKKSLDKWTPRNTKELTYLPTGEASKLPPGSPERVVAELIENWKAKRWGPLAESLICYTNEPLGKRAGEAKADFGTHTPTSYEILSIKDEAPATSITEVTLNFEKDGARISKKCQVKTIYQDKDNYPTIRNNPSGAWKIIQNSFMHVIYLEEL